MKYYKVIKQGFGLDYLTLQDTVGFWCDIGQEIKVSESKVWFKMKNGKWRETINWPDIVELGLKNKQLEETLENN